METVSFRSELRQFLKSFRLQSLGQVHGRFGGSARLATASAVGATASLKENALRLERREHRHIEFI